MSINPVILFLLVAVLFSVALCASGCVTASAPSPGSAVPTVTGNGTAIIAPALTARICHCPMEPAGMPTGIPAQYPDDGRCHCP